MCDERWKSGAQIPHQKTFKKLEKSSWQSDWDVLEYKSSSEPTGGRVTIQLKSLFGAEKVWKNLKKVIDKRKEMC